MEQNNLGAIFQATDPNYGKSDSEIFQERVRQMQMQNLNKQMANAQSLQGQIAQTPEKEFNRGGAVAAALADVWAPNTNAFGKYMAINKATPDKKAQLQARLEKAQAGVNSGANALAKNMGQSSSIQNQMDLANLRQKNAKELFDYKKTREGGAIGELTPGQKKMDVAFGIDQQKWTSGGYSNTKANLKKMEGVMGKLAEGQPELGKNFMPQALRAFSEPNVVGLEQDIEQITFQSLKEILGGNFTKGEADRMVAQAYDPKLSNEQNREKIKASYAQLKEKMEAKQAASAYFSEHGSLKGFRGMNLENMKDFEKQAKKELLGGETKTSFKSDAAKNLAKEFGL